MQKVCLTCGAVSDPTDKFCRHCGSENQNVMAEAATVPVETRRSERISEGRILLIGVVIVGALLTAIFFALTIDASESTNQQIVGSDKQSTVNSVAASSASEPISLTSDYVLGRWVNLGQDCNSEAMSFSSDGYMRMRNGIGRWSVSPYSNEITISGTFGQSVVWKVQELERGRMTIEDLDGRRGVLERC